MGEIMFLAHRVPWPPDRGDRIRSWHLLRHLAARAPVHLLAFSDDGTDRPCPIPLASQTIVQRRIGRVEGVLRALVTGRPVSLAMFDSPLLRAHVRHLLDRHPIDTIFAFSGQMAQFVPPHPRPRFIMDFVDVDSAKFDSYAQGAGPATRWLHAREGRLLGAFERAVARGADASLFVSAAEAALFRARGGSEAGGFEDRVHAIGNGIDLDHFRPAPFAHEGLVVFTGQMDYPPNIDAVCSFARTVFPRLRAKVPDARFAIVGRNPARAVAALARDPGVIVTGAVPDVRPWIARASAVVAPLGIARGIQNKVLEAMATGRPVVASPAAAEGLEPGEGLIVADLPAMASELADLLGDAARCERLGAAARSHVEARYRWDARLAPLDALLDR